MADHDTETAIIGALLLHGDRLVDVADALIPEDFADRRLGRIFEAMLILSDQGRPVDVFTVSEALRGTGKTLAYLGELAKTPWTAANLLTYTRMVRDNSVSRQLAEAGAKIQEAAGTNTPLAEKLDRCQSLVMGVADQTTKSGSGPTVIRKVLSTVIDQIDACYQNPGEIPGLSTGFTDLDELTAGMHPADFVIVAGRPSMGKTAFAMNIVEHVTQDNAALVFSMEMPKEQLTMRLCSSRARIELSGLRRGELQEDDWHKLTAAMGDLSERHIIIDDTPALSVHELRARARRVHRDNPLSLIVIDYLQLMQGDGNTRSEIVDSISRGLKALAKELNIPVIALSQLNRSLESRPNKRPRMSDLREAGGIEQDADLILFLYRDEVYDDASPYQGMAECIVSKQRNGALGTVHLTFLGQYTRFENFAGEWPQPVAASSRRGYSGGFDYSRTEQ